MLLFKEFLQNRMMESRIASMKTLNSNKKSRIRYAYKALERDSMNDVDGAEESFTRFLSSKMSKEDQLYWALRQVEFLQLTEGGNNENI